MKKLIIIVVAIMGLVASLSAQWKTVHTYLIVDKDTTEFEYWFRVDEFTPECEIVVKKCDSSEYKESWYEPIDSTKFNYKCLGLKKQRTLYEGFTVKKENTDVKTEILYPTDVSSWWIVWEIILFWVFLFISGLLLIKKQKTIKKIKIVIGVVFGVLVAFLVEISGMGTDYVNNIGYVITMIVLLSVALGLVGWSFDGLFSLPFSGISVVFASFALGSFIDIGINRHQWLPMVIGIGLFCLGLLCRYLCTKQNTTEVEEKAETTTEVEAEIEKE
jgi:hypothetical protein